MYHRAVPPDRFRVATALPPDGGWRSELALDREATPPRPVRLARVPPAVSGDAMALAALARGVDLTARLSHPALQPVLGLAEAGGGLVVVAPFREGETLRAVLDGGGALPPGLASRVVGEVARALQAAHGLAAAGPGGLAHGAVRPEAVLIAEDGAVLLTGLGRPTDPPARPSDDLAALPRLLLECLAPGGVGAPPAELAPLCQDATEPPRSAGDYAEALAAAVPPASPGALVARVDSAIPKGPAARASRRRALAQALLAEAGGEAGPLLTPSAGLPVTTGPASSAPPALSPPPFRSPLAQAPPGLETAADRAGPAAAQAASVPTPSAAAGAGPAVQPAAAPPRGRGGPPSAPVARHPGPAPAHLPPSLLDDPRLPVRLAVALGIAGLIAGFLLGR